MPIPIKIEKRELYNEKENYFYKVPEMELEFEHSLLAISKWESKWHIPFLKKEERTREQALSYIECMCITPNVAHEVFYALTPAQIQEIMDYIDDPMSATTVTHREQSRGRGEIITSELIYFWMNEANIPKECELWHLNRLFKLIEVTSVKRQPDKKMTRRQTGAQNKALNAARRAKMGSRG